MRSKVLIALYIGLLVVGILGGILITHYVNQSKEKSTSTVKYPLKTRFVYLSDYNRLAIIFENPYNLTFERIKVRIDYDQESMTFKTTLDKPLSYGESSFIRVSLQCEDVMAVQCWGLTS